MRCGTDNIPRLRAPGIGLRNKEVRPTACKDKHRVAMPLAAIGPLLELPLPLEWCCKPLGPGDPRKDFAIAGDVSTLLILLAQWSCVVPHRWGMLRSPLCPTPCVQEPIEVLTPAPRSRRPCRAGARRSCGLPSRPWLPAEARGVRRPCRGARGCRPLPHPGAARRAPLAPGHGDDDALWGGLLRPAGRRCRPPPH